jgi:hypothetical protein
MMKLVFNKAIVIALGLFALVAAMPANAQVSYMRATVPFAFVAGQTTLPPGEYRLKVDAQTRVLQIQPATSTATYYVLLSPSTDSRLGGPVDKGKLQFRRVDGKYYLGEVWRPEQNLGNRLSVPKKTERENTSSRTASTPVDIMAK